MRPRQSEYSFLDNGIIFLDPPSSPLYPKIIAQSISSAVLTWTPPTHLLCVSSYTITLINITEGNTSYTYNTTTNTTYLTVSDLTQGAEYSFTVAGVNAGGRVGNESVLAGMITFDSEFHIFALNAITVFKNRYFTNCS